MEACTWRPIRKHISKHVGLCNRSHLYDQECVFVSVCVCLCACTCTTSLYLDSSLKIRGTIYVWILLDRGTCCNLKYGNVRSSYFLCSCTVVAVCVVIYRRHGVPRLVVSKLLRRMTLFLAWGVRPFFRFLMFWFATPMRVSTLCKGIARGECEWEESEESKDEKETRGHFECLCGGKYQK